MSNENWRDNPLEYTPPVRRDGTFMPAETSMSACLEQLAQMGLAPADILAMAAEFVVLEDDRKSPLRRDVTVKRRMLRDGSVKWAVYVSGMVVDRNGEWSFECLPSSRTDEYLAMRRFHSLPEAMAHARRAVKKVFDEREAFIAELRAGRNPHEASS